MADVSISGSEAGPSGRHAMPDDDPSLYTHSIPTAAAAQPMQLLWLPTARLAHLSDVMQQQHAGTY